MRQSELLGRVANGAILRIARDPWGRLLPSVVLVEPGAQGNDEIVHRWQIRKMMDSGLLQYDGSTAEDSSMYVPTSAGLAIGNAWNRAKARAVAAGAAAAGPAQGSD
ncbi:hypothetical protein [Cupriavidus sp. UME77]|uniref:hypothetical protein n=1 Tax=Cupriavidus sp. UME77 TaxID=1862321 RepID=UPI001603F1AA|nr:hypothetical protein [Cupriavidus sp. UME77]MBB1631264.1 hypothetical protein [Cupriavidus sp. UME77]